MTTAQGFTDQGAMTYPALIAGEFPRVTRMVTIATGADLTAGAVLGKITATGKYVLSDEAAVNGSEVVEAILGQDAAAAGADVQAMIYESGEFNEDALSFGGTNDADSVRDALRAKSIFLKKALGA